MSLAELRAPRKTAGNRLSGLLGREEEDEFYKTTYGGFNEVWRGPEPVYCYCTQHRGALYTSLPEGEGLLSA